MKIKIVLVVLFALSTVFAGGSQGGGVGAASVRTESVKESGSKGISETRELKTPREGRSK